MEFPRLSFVEKDDKVEMIPNAVFVSCGCGSTNARYVTVLSITGIPSRMVDHVKPATHKLAKRWLEQEGYYEKIPGLSKKVYGFLINKNGEWLDINDYTTVDCANRFKEVYNGGAK